MLVDMPNGCHDDSEPTPLNALVNVCVCARVWVCVRASYLAFLHARPDRVCIRLIFLNQELKLPVVVLRLPVQTLISPDTLAASLPRGHIQGAIQIVQTRKPVKQIQKWVGITKRKIQIAQIHVRQLCPLVPSIGEAQAHGLRVRESKAVFEQAVRVTGVHSPQRFGRIH